MSSIPTIRIRETDLLDYFAGILPPERNPEVERWIEASEENFRLARDIRYICVAADMLEKMGRIDAVKVLADIERRIEQRRRRRFYLRIAKVAAVFLPVLLLLTYLVWSNFSEEEYLIISSGNKQHFSTILPDGSEVWMNTGTTLWYPARFKGKKRQVRLSGEAYFKVVKQTNKTFHISLPYQAGIEVLGTEFNISAYEQDNEITATLIRGSIRVEYINEQNEDDSLIMEPEQKLVYDKKTRHASLVYTDVRRSTDWKEGKIVLRNTPLEEMIRKLNRKFQVHFLVENDSLWTNSFSGTFEEETLPEILEHLKISSDIQYKLAGKDMVILY